MVRGARVADEAVRAYMEALQDPNSAVDWDHVDDLAGQITEATDPVRRVLLRSQWRQASDPATYIPDLEADFVAFAGQWAEANQVIGDDFFYEGVPLPVLRQAGLNISDEAAGWVDEDEMRAAEEVVDTTDRSESTRVVPVSTPTPSATPTAGSEDPDSPTGRAVAAMTEQPFTVAELAEQADVSRTVVRQLIERMEADGELIKGEPDEETGDSTWRRA
ncbi:helix-turn-helix domain-containing protein [Stomatohabitans albus]|uniref:helix-turn-helix domain-containing protein n=1 Tax=Stomatohabitans albus TaxID=3110766 RepID=UPI00300C460B